MEILCNVLILKHVFPFGIFWFMKSQSTRFSDLEQMSLISGCVDCDHIILQFGVRVVWWISRGETGLVGISVSVYGASSQASYFSFFGLFMKLFPSKPCPALPMWPMSWRAVHQLSKLILHKIHKMSVLCVVASDHVWSLPILTLLWVSQCKTASGSAWWYQPQGDWGPLWGT